jgi:sensor histidine kinase YesM
MKRYKDHNLKGKMLFVLIPVLLGAFLLASVSWYITARKNADYYLDNITNAYMNDARSNFDFILTDTFHMITLISLNEKSIVEPIAEINSIPNDSRVLDMEYLTNYRAIKQFITTMNGYKYYIVGIGIASANGYVYQTSSILKDLKDLLKVLDSTDKTKIKTSMVMLDPMQIEGSWIKLKSDYVIPAVRGIIDPETNELLGYTILYFDYSLLETMFSDNLPEGSFFQVTNKEGKEIFSNTEKPFLSSSFSKKEYRYSSLTLKDVDWTLKIAIPNTIVMRNINESILVTVLILIPIIVVLSIILILIITSFSNRIEKISNTMKSVGETKQIRKMIEGTNNDELETIVHSYNEMTDEINDLMEQIKVEESLKAEQRIRLLQAQINPHFISNTLNTISWMAKKQKANNIVPLTDSMNILLRSLLKIDNQFISLSDEIKAVESYINIMLLSGNYDFDVNWNIQENTGDIQILRFILQPIVENAILHGFINDDLLKMNTLTINSYLLDDKLLIEVIDNGKGLNKCEIDDLLRVKDAKKVTGINGIGCANVKERMELVYGETASIVIESELGKYTKVTYRFDHYKVIKGAR